MPQLESNESRVLNHIACDVRLTFFSLLLRRLLRCIGLVIIGASGAHRCDMSVALWALFIHIVIIVIILLIVVIVQHLASHEWHGTLHELFLILRRG